MADAYPTPELIASMEAIAAAKAAKDEEHFIINQRAEMVKLSSATLIENNRSKPVDERGISSSDVTTYADTLISFVNQK